jgi:hypothetical protein
MNSSMDKDVHLGQGEIFDEDREINRRAVASEQDIASGRVKNAKNLSRNLKSGKRRSELIEMPLG